MHVILVTAGVGMLCSGLWLPGMRLEGPRSAAKAVAAPFNLLLSIALLVDLLHDPLLACCLSVPLMLFARCVTAVVRWVLAALVRSGHPRVALAEVQV